MGSKNKKMGKRTKYIWSANGMISVSSQKQIAYVKICRKCVEAGIKQPSISDMVKVGKKTVTNFTLKNNTN